MLLKYPEVAVLSDIHGNFEALKIVREILNKKGIRQVLFLGDLVGYFYEVENCLSLLQEYELYAVCGNHEDIYRKLKTGELDENIILNKYGSGVMRTIANQSIEVENFIMALPITMNLRFENNKIKIAHGDLQDFNSYIYHDSPDLKNGKLDLVETQNIFLGNTHRQMIFVGENTIIVNPGSVGLSRSRKSTVQFSICNLNTSEISFYNLKYLPVQTKNQFEMWDANNLIMKRYFD